MKSIISLIFIFLVIFLNHINCVIVHTKQGILKGQILSSRRGRPFHAFFSVPFAEPPVGELRLKNPVPARPWSGIKDATIPSPICLHVRFDIMTGQEDCLYLNLYTPNIKNTSLLPVMVYTYGGRFMHGDASLDVLGPHYFMDRDVILITYHYRLGVFGFLSTEDEVIPGNYGLKDQVAVLQWIQNYIDDFGGDKNRVTLFGDSSGGISASLALVSPIAKGLFHRLITQSGHAFDIERPGKARLNAWKYASFVGCDNETVKTSEDLLNCIRNIPAEDLAAYNTKLFTLGFILPALPWGPVIESEKVEGAFLVDEPRKLLERESDIPWMIGMNSDDGGMIALMAYHPNPSPLLDEFDNNYKTHFPLIFRYGYNVNSTEQVDYLSDAYKTHYFGEKKISENIHGFSDMFTALIYIVGINETVRLYKGPKYVFLYDHASNQSFAKFYSKNEAKMGVIHGDELISTFNWSRVITPVTEGIDLVVSENVVRLWTNFAIKGDPNDDGETLFEPLKTSTINYLHIKDEFEMKNDFYKSEMDFLYSLPIDHYF